MSSPGGPKRIGSIVVAPRLEGAGDDLLRGAVAPHRVDRDAGQATAYGAWMWSGSTSRPL